MILFNLNSPGDTFEKRIFPNGETQLILRTKVKGLSCEIISRSLHSNLFDLILLSDLLKKEGAKKVIAVIPYFAYSRQDMNEENKSWGMKSLAKIFKSSGIDKIITLDLHSESGQKLFGNQLVSIDVAELFAAQIKKMRLKNFCIIAPDEGAIHRVGKLASILNSSKFGYFKKIRTDRIKHYEYEGEHGKTAIIYDDILDTGGTLLGTAKELRSRGFEEIYIFVTHGQFTGTKWKKMFKLGVKEIYTTNTIVPIIKDKRIKVLSATPLIKEFLLS